MKKQYTKTNDIYNDNLFFDQEIYANEDELSQFNLEVLARNAAQRIIQAALEAEVIEFLDREKYDKIEAENFRGYRNGHHRQRTVSTAFGGLKVQVPCVSDAPQAYQSQLVRKYKRRSQPLDCLFPKLFVEGLATRDFEPALQFARRRTNPAVAFDNFAP